MKQATIKKTIRIKGVGIHKNNINHISLKPANENNGISIVNQTENIKQISPEIIQSSKYQISVGVKSQIYTTEHLLSTLYSLEISNCTIVIEKGNEIPILDGSSRFFAKEIIESGIIKQKAPQNIKNIPFPVCLKIDDRYIIALPPKQNNKLKINADISFPQYKIKENYSLVLSKKNFINKIAKARTFGFIEYHNALKAQDLALGANYNNCLVFSKEKLLNPPLRYDNECVRHKILDFIASLSIVNYRMMGEFYLYKSGHRLDAMFIKILDQIISKKNIDPKYKENIIMDRNKINELIDKALYEREA